MKTPSTHRLARTGTLATAIATLLAVQSADATALTWNLTTGGDWDTTAANWTEAPNTFTDGGVDDLTFNKTNGGTIMIAADMSPISTTVSATSGTYIFSGGPIDSGTLAKSGAGILTLSGANNFSGVTLSAGQLNINNAGALGTGTFTISGGTIDNTSESTVTLSTVTPQAWNANFTWNATKDLNLGTGTVTLGSTLTIGISAAGSAATLTVGGNIAGGFGLTLTQRNPASNPKVVALTGSNTYTGNTAGANFGNGVATLRADDGIGLPGGSLLALTELVIETGTDLVRPSGGSAGHYMRVAQAGSSTGASGFSAYGGPVNVAFGTSLANLESLTWGSTNFNPGNNARGLILNEKTANNALDFKNNINLNTQTGIVIVNATNAAAIATMSGVLSGTGTSGLKKNGVGTLVLSGANTYSGNTTVSGGVLSITSAYLADTSTVTIASGAKLDLNTGGASDTIATLVLNGVTVPNGTYNSSTPLYGSYFTGSGSLAVGVPSSVYATWSSGLANPAFDFDSDHNGIPNGLQWILGGTQTQSNPAAIALLETLDATDLQLTFKRVDASVTETTLTAEWDVDLAGTWTSVPVNETTAGTYTHANGVTVTVVTNDAAPDDITVRIPRSNAVGGKLFARLKATQP